MNGTVGILNVGAGDIKISFDKNNPAERIRAARIVKDMLRRGYALLVLSGETEGGTPVYQRATAFDEERCEYIVADFDPVAAAEHDEQEQRKGLDDGPAHSIIEPKAAQADGATPAPRRRGRPRRVPAESTHAVAVSRTAGG